MNHKEKKLNTDANIVSLKFSYNTDLRCYTKELIYIVIPKTKNSKYQKLQKNKRRDKK